MCPLIKLKVYYMLTELSGVISLGQHVQNPNLKAAVTVKAPVAGAREASPSSQPAFPSPSLALFALPAARLSSPSPYQLLSLCRLIVPSGVNYYLMLMTT